MIRNENGQYNRKRLKVKKFNIKFIVIGKVITYNLSVRVEIFYV